VLGVEVEAEVGAWRLRA